MLRVFVVCTHTHYSYYLYYEDANTDIKLKSIFTFTHNDVMSRSIGNKIGCWPIEARFNRVFAYICECEKYPRVYVFVIKNPNRCSFRNAHEMLCYF